MYGLTVSHNSACMEEECIITVTVAVDADDTFHLN